MSYTLNLFHGVSNKISICEIGENELLWNEEKKSKSRERTKQSSREKSR